MDYAENIREDGANSPVFDEYLRVSEPHTRERAQAWKTAIGLQAVDGLQVSEYLKETAQRHIEGEISIDEAQSRVRSYYRTRIAGLPDDAERQEADMVSVNIAKLLGEQSFSFSVPCFFAPGTPASCPSTSASTTPTTSPASSVSVPENVSETVFRLVAALGEKQLSVKEAMAAAGLKDRKNFVRYSLNPALELGIVAPLYPKIPNHPRQKYFLTESGLACFSATKSAFRDGNVEACDS